MTNNAPGQYLGYSLQTTRFLARLLDADLDSSVSLEVFDDVGVETPEGRRVAEQTKSALTCNPVADHARDLWKTFGNWLDALRSGHLISEKTSFELYVSGNKSGEIVRDFSDATSGSQAQGALLRARDKLWGPSPVFPLKSDVAETIRPFVTKIFEASEEDVCAIIANFRFESGGSSPQHDVRQKLATRFVAPEILDEVLNHAQGWIKRQIDLRLEQSLPACISAEQFQAEMVSFVRKHDKRTILATFAGAPSPEEVDRDLQFRSYVRQLALIDVDEEHKIRAVNDFLRASSDRTQWSVKGFVHESSFHEFESGLIRTWDNFRTKTALHMRGSSDVDRGQYLYAECSSHRACIEGLEVPDHFTPGSFHSLADSLDIGWHPDYRSALDAPDQNEEE